MKKSEAFDSSLKKTFDECCEGEELKKEWEREFVDKLFSLSTPPLSPSDLGCYNFPIEETLLKELLDFISSLLAKQQEENQKIIDGIFEIKEKELARQREEFVKMIDEIKDRKFTDPNKKMGYSHAIGDIKSKLNK
jgi:uncharacterized protein YerC